jgi:hypothetical protein
VKPASQLDISLEVFKGDASRCPTACYMTDAGSNLKMGPLVKLNVSSLALEIQSLPSQAHLDLFKAGIINDPLLGINDALCNLPMHYPIVHSSQNSRKDGLSTTTGRTPRT